MKKFSISIVGLIVVLSTMLVACSQHEEIMDNEVGTIKEEVVYNLHLDCSAPCYDEDMATRGTTSWADGSEVYLLFKDGIKGTAIYNDGKWALRVNGSLEKISGAECSAAYVENPASTNGQVVNMHPTSTLYRGEGSYTVDYTDVYVKVTLSPDTWRLRFKGSNGTKISLSGDVSYHDYLGVTKFYTMDLTKDVTLTVNSNNYTDYIHGEFVNKSGNNTLCLVNETEGNTYYRENISGNSLAAGEGAYLTIPTENTYASLGWEILANTDPNATIETDILAAFTDRMLTQFTFGSTASMFYYTVLEYSESYNDKEMIEHLLSETEGYSVKEYSTYSFTYGGLNDNTKYILFAVALNNNGEAGELHKTLFTTKPSSAPIAEISNLAAAKQEGTLIWSWNVTLKNNAVKYYGGWYIGESGDSFFYDQEDYWLAYWIYRDIVMGENTSTYDFQSVYLGREEAETHFSLILFAVDAKGNIGNWSCGKATSSSYTRGVQKVSHRGEKAEIQYAKRPEHRKSFMLQSPFLRATDTLKK